MKLFTVRWSRRAAVVEIEALDELGNMVVVRKRYQDWIGVATADIQNTVVGLKRRFKGAKIRHERLGKVKEILPLFYDRVMKNQFDPDEKRFYKVYFENTSMSDVGLLLNHDCVSYYRREDWLTRIYIDLCTKLDCSDSFYYNWYDVDELEPDLLKSFRATYPSSPLPPMTIASFDLETVPWEVGAKRLPTGHDENDRIVMASLVLSDVASGRTKKKYLFYLNPIAEKLTTDTDVEYREFQSEKTMLVDFLQVLGDRETLFVTGYNINKFDFPCLFARAVYLNCGKEVLNNFSSVTLGKHLVTTYRGKFVIDMYTYILTFSPYNLPSFKLDDVAFARLGERKVAVRATSIHHWYQARDRLDKQILESNDLRECFDFVRPDFPESQFGTFRTCLSYCLKDSELVLRIAHKENAIRFLMARSNMSSMNAEEVLYYGVTRYIQNVFESYGTSLGYFFNVPKLRNVTGDDTHGQFLDRVVGKNKARYQGALNYCRPGFYRNVAVYDFESLYPSSIIVGNISYETFAVVHVDDLANLSLENRDRCRCIPLQVHDDKVVFEQQPQSVGKFQFPTELEYWVMVARKDQLGFLPTILGVLKEKRRKEKQLPGAYHYTRQLNLKLLMNSMYGILGSPDSALSNIGAGMSVTCIARNLLLGAYHFATSKGYAVPYADTDSLFLVDARKDERLDVVDFFDDRTINLQYENFFPTMLILKKKKYCYEVDGMIKTKGMEVKSNELTKRMLKEILHESYAALKQGRPPDPGEGCLLLVRLLVDAYLTSRWSPLVNCMTRKVRSLDSYVEQCKAPHVRLMRRNPDRDVGNFISFTHIVTNISQKGNDKINPVFVEDVDETYHTLDFEKLFKSQHSLMLGLLSLGFFGGSSLLVLYNELVERIKWKQIVNASIVSGGEQPLILTLKGFRYTFKRK